MKVTNEELLKLFKLKVGDEIVIKDFYVGEDETCKARVVKRKSPDGTDKILLNLIGVVGQVTLSSLTMYDYEIHQAHPIGDTMCDEYTCFECPLRHLAGCDNNKDEETLYTKLNRVFETDSDNPIYKVYKAILDKEE